MRIYPETVSISEIDLIITSYFSGIKQIIFVGERDIMKQIVSNVVEKFDAEGILIKGKKFIINSQNKNDLTADSNSVNLFNFEIYCVKGIKTIFDSSFTVKNGAIPAKEQGKIEELSKTSGFNLQQYMVEHAPIDSDIVVKAGAGTGKTFSMISRISFICHQSSKANILDVKNEIAMLTFTTGAATNMKTRLKLTLKKL